MLTFFQNSVQKVLHKDCLLKLDGAALNIDQVIKIECGEEEDENIEYQFKEIIKGVDYVETYDGEIIFIRITKELLTGYIYHIKVTATLKNGKGEGVFNSKVHPRGTFKFYHEPPLFFTTC